MHAAPSANLVNLLARLRLATPEQIQSVASRVRRLAGELPDFESVWVDALSQARILTPFQAAEINAGRGDALLHGPYVVAQPVKSPAYATCFSARHIETARPVRLYVVARPHVAPVSAARALEHLIEQLALLAGPTSGAIEDAGISGDGVWAACAPVEGSAASDWMVENGRFPPPVVLQIARDMLPRLADLEKLGVAHGDIGAAGLWLQTSARVALPMPGLRGVVRPSEGYAFGDLSCEAYDYLAPERIASGSPASLSTDIYACGCLWWHLLTGRPPFAGGNSLAKLKAVHGAKTIDVRQLAPEVPEILARAIELCLQREPQHRPQSTAPLIAMLGPPTRAGSAALARVLHREGQPWHKPMSTRKQHGPRRLRLVAACSTALAALFFLALFSRYRSTPVASDAWAAKQAIPQQSRDNRESQLAAVESAHGHEKLRKDSLVRPAAATQPIVGDAPSDLVLATGKTLELKRLKLLPGQRVRGAGSARPSVKLSTASLVVDCDDVTFENIDFICGKNDAETQLSAMIRVETASASFRGCSFSCDDAPAAQAIVWRQPNENSDVGRCELNFTDCVFSGVKGVVDLHNVPLANIAFDNALCVAAGPIVVLHRMPKDDESLALTLDHVTTRGDCTILECRYARLEPKFGSISIAATDSAFDTNPGGGLLVFAGQNPPGEFLQGISWGGQGSLVTPRAAMAVWRSGAGKQQLLSEEELDVAGLVRSQVDYAGDAPGPPTASRITRWQVPLRSPDPPGANTSLLFLPE